MGSKARWMSYQQVAARIACGTSTVRKMVSAGKFPPPHDIQGVGKRFWSEDVDVWIFEQRSKQLKGRETGPK